MSTPHPHPFGDGLGTAATLTLATPVHRGRRRSPRADEFGDDATERRQLVRAVFDLLRERCRIASHPNDEGRRIVVNLNRATRKVVPADIAAEAEERYRAYLAEPDPALLPPERGGDGHLVDPYLVCRHLGLDEETARHIAERGSGDVAFTEDVKRGLLDRCRSNRQLSPSQVARHVRTIDAGEWVDKVGEVSVDRNGNLINGQHRLHAFLQTGLSPVMTLKVGVPPEGFNVTDTGKPRFASDALGVAGQEFPTERATIVRNLAAAERGRLWLTGRVLEIPDVLRRSERLEEPRFTECIAEGKALSRRSRGLASASAFAFLLWCYDEEHHDAIRVYAEQVAMALGFVEEHQPARTVRVALEGDRSATKKLGWAGKLALLIRGAEAHLAGQTMRYARVRRAGDWPSPTVPASWGWPKQRPPRGGQKAEEAG